MATYKGFTEADFDRALDAGRPPNVKRLFPNSRGLLVSGKYVNNAMAKKGAAIAMAANGRNSIVIRGAMRAAQKANCGLIVEIARSEGGLAAYCPTSMWNIASQVDQIANEYGITIPVAVHADHFGIKKPADIEPAKGVIPTLLDYGITSIAIDASHMPDDENLLATLELAPLLPPWMSLETEVGEIKGDDGLSDVPESVFLIQGLNAHGYHPTWIALNNGSSHGIQASDAGIQVERTAAIHDAIAKYGVYGAQHGTSGNNSDRLREIADQTRTTKANVATALQMVSWGVNVDDYGNAVLDDEGHLQKVEGAGVTEELWAEMMAKMKAENWTGSNTKKLNLPFENHLVSQPAEIRERCIQGVEDFAYNMMANVFNATDTAPLAIEAINEAGNPNAGAHAERIEDPADWTPEKIRERAAAMDTDKGPEGDFDD